MYEDYTFTHRHVFHHLLQRGITLLYRIWLASIIVTPFALFRGSLRIELHCSSIRTNRAILLKRSCIRSVTCFPPNRATLVLVILDNRDGKDSGARFTKHLKPNIFLSAIQITNCMALKKTLGLRCLVKRAPELQTCWAVFSSCSLYPPPTDGRTDTQTASAKT